MNLALQKITQGGGIHVTEPQDSSYCWVYPCVAVSLKVNTEIPEFDSVI